MLKLIVLLESVNPSLKLVAKQVKVTSRLQSRLGSYVLCQQLTKRFYSVVCNNRRIPVYRSAHGGLTSCVPSSRCHILHAFIKLPTVFLCDRVSMGTECLHALPTRHTSSRRNISPTHSLFSHWGNSYR